MKNVTRWVLVYRTATGELKHFYTMDWNVLSNMIWRLKDENCKDFQFYREVKASTGSEAE
jgi:hypothetical protein